MNRRFPPLALAQVEAVHPAEYQLSVVFPNYANLVGIRVTVGSPQASAYAGEYALPRRGDWGLVAFWQDDPRTAVWLMNMPDRIWNSIPRENLSEDPQLRARYEWPGIRRLIFGSGDQETILPDGSLFRVTHTKDGSLSNVGNRTIKTLWKVGEAVARGVRKEARKSINPGKAPSDVVFAHASGASVVITADGRVDVGTPRGHHIKLHDATEKKRRPEPPYNIYQTPEEDDNRKVSELKLTSEIGAYLVFHDDPVEQKNRYVELMSLRGHHLRFQDKIEQNVYIELATALGHKLFARDKIDEDQHIDLESAGGHKIELRDTPVGSNGIHISTALQHRIDMNDDGGGDLIVKHKDGSYVRLGGDGNVYVFAVGAVIVEGGDGVKLGSAGASRPIARIGDQVDPGTLKIISGADNVFSD